MKDITRLRLTLDVESLNGCLSSLADAADRSLEVRQALLDALDAGVEFFRLYVDDRPTAAGELRIRAQLADRFAELVSASGALERDAVVVKDAAFHGKGASDDE